MTRYSKTPPIIILTRRRNLIAYEISPVGRNDIKDGDSQALLFDGNLRNDHSVLHNVRDRFANERLAMTVRFS